MANEFLGNPGECISWSNGLTRVLIARVAVAAAELLRDDWEYEFARYVATRDQSYGGLGCVGFDMIDIPWGPTPELFVSRRKFVVEVIVHAASAGVADRLPYYPNPDREEIHRECLREYALMAHHFDRNLFQERREAWDHLLPPTDVMCVRHRLFCHAYGCMVCPDG